MRFIAAAALAGILGSFAVTAAAAPQDPVAEKKARQQAGLKEKFEARLQDPWFVDFGWTADYDKARERAAAEKKLIFAYFSRSDIACPNCLDFEGRTVVLPEFKEFGKDYVLFAHITTRIEGRKYEGLFKEKGGRTFPYVIAMDAEGNFLGEMQERTLPGLRKMMDEGAEYLSLKTRKDLAPAEQLRLFGLQLYRDVIKPEEYRAKAGALQGLDEAARKERDQRIIEIDIMVYLARYRKITGPNPELRLEISRAFRAMKNEGRIPESKYFAIQFSGFMFDIAELDKDPELYEWAYRYLRKHEGEQDRLKEYWLKLEAKLAEIKSARAALDAKKDEPKKDDPK